jgi:Extensin-like protein C-terminus
VQPRSLRSKTLLGIVAVVFALTRPASARAFSPYLVIPEPGVAEATPAFRYANMSDAEAFAELDQRKILYTKLDRVPGVRAPVRLTGRLHGVYVHSSLPPEQRVTSMFEILDARLLLALDDFAAILERHEIDEVIHFTMYRPNVAPPGQHEVEDEPEAKRSGKPAGAPASAPLPATPVPGRARASSGGGPSGGGLKRPALATSAGSLKQKAAPPGDKPVIVLTASAARASTGTAAKAAAASVTKVPAASVANTCRSQVASAARPKSGPIAHRDPQPGGLHQTTWAPPGTRHPAGLAIDVGLVHKKDGHWLSVAQHFHGIIGARTCGEGAFVPEAPEARELHALVCEASDKSVFTYVLTPDYNAAHADHFHMEVKPGVRWFLYH